MLKKMEIKDFDQVYTLMEESFPKDEYRDYQKQTKETLEYCSAVAL